MAAQGLSIGQELSPADIQTIEQRETIEQAREAALRLLGYRPRSTAEVRRKLEQKGYADDIIQTVIDRLCAVELLNDEAFARYWVEQRETFKPRSPMALRQELGQKGISRSTIDAVLQSVNPESAARKAAEKKARQLANLSEDVFRNRLGGFLQRRGFKYELINQITEEMWLRFQKETSDDENGRHI